MRHETVSASLLKDKYHVILNSTVTTIIAITIYSHFEN